MKKIYIIILGIVAMGLLVFLAGSVPSVFSEDPIPTPYPPPWYPTPTPGCVGGCPNYTKPICLIDLYGGGTCVQCVLGGVGGDCPASVPYCVDYTCVECMDDDHDCNFLGFGSKPYCVDGRCVQCRDKDDCSGSTPYCWNNQCVECENAAQCGDPGCINAAEYRSYACASHQCVPLTMNCLENSFDCCSSISGFCGFVIQGLCPSPSPSPSPTPTPT